MAGGRGPRRARPGGDRWLIVGAVVSVLAHALVVAWVVGASAGADRDGGAVLRTSDEHETPPPPEVRFGEVHSDRVSINWLGFEAPSEEHAARAEAETEQAAMSPEAAGGPAGSVPVPPAPEQASPGLAQQTPARPQPEPAEPTQDPAQGPPPAAVAVVPESPMVGPPAPPRPASGAPDRPEAPATAESRPNPSPPGTGGQGETEGAGAGRDPGLPADRESTDVALEKTLEIKDWTSPIVGEGIRIRTVRPQMFAHFAGVRFPKPAVIELRFRRHGETGVVTKAEFVKEKRPGGLIVTHSTGDPVLDGLVLDSVYRWTGEGAAIDALKGEQGLVVRVRFSWVR